MAPITNAQGIVLHHQCCVCMLPAAPEGHDRYAITHGYHRECFIEHHKDDFEPDEMAEILSTNTTFVEGY